RFRQRHFQSKYKARARRRPVPRARKYRTSNGGAQRAWPAPAKRAAYRARLGLCGPELRLVGSSVLRTRSEAISVACREIRLWQIASAFARRNPRTFANLKD